MFRFTRRSLILAAALFPAGLNECAHGAQVDSDPPPVQFAPSAMPPKPEFAVPAEGYNIEQLGNALRNMGYDPTPVKNISGGTFYKVSFHRGTWTFVFTVCISNDKSLIWFAAPLTHIPSSGQTSPQAILKLLEKNYEIGPMFFHFRGGQENRVYLSRPFANRSMTPAALRAEMEDFLATLQATHSLWNEKALIVQETTDVPQKQASAEVP